MCTKFTEIDSNTRIIPNILTPTSFTVLCAYIVYRLKIFQLLEKCDALIDTTEISKEVTETKMKLSTLQQNYNKQSSALSTIETEISVLEKSFETSSEKKSHLERQLQQIKTRSKVIADFYTDRDLKFHTRLGVENQARSFSENELQAMEQKEQLKKDEIEEYRKQVFELKEQISKQDRDHAERLQTLKRAEHADWILHKEMEKELRMKRFELEQMKEKISELEEQVIVVRNAACLGAPSSKPSLADVYLENVEKIDSSLFLFLTLLLLSSYKECHVIVYDLR